MIFLSQPPWTLYCCSATCRYVVVGSGSVFWRFHFSQQYMIQLYSYTRLHAYVHVASSYRSCTCTVHAREPLSAAAAQNQFTDPMIACCVHMHCSTLLTQEIAVFHPDPIMSSPSLVNSDSSAAGSGEENQSVSSEKLATCQQGGVKRLSHRQSQDYNHDVDTWPMRVKRKTEKLVDGELDARYNQSCMTFSLIILASYSCKQYDYTLYILQHAMSMWLKCMGYVFVPTSLSLW